MDNAKLLIAMCAIAVGFAAYLNIDGARTYYAGKKEIAKIQQQGGTPAQVQQRQLEAEVKAKQIEQEAAAKEAAEAATRSGASTEDVQKAQLEAQQAQLETQAAQIELLQKQIELMQKMQGK